MPARTLIIDHSNDALYINIRLGLLQKKLRPAVQHDDRSVHTSPNPNSLM